MYVWYSTEYPFLESPSPKAFFIEIAGYVFKMFLKELCHRQFFGNFTNFFRIATFQNSGQLLQISPEIAVTSLLYLFNFF